MYSLHLSCGADDVDLLSAELWELGTAGIRELEYGEGVTLIAGFENNGDREDLLRKFAAFSPEWQLEDAVDWVRWTHDAWPARRVGERLFLAPPWCKEETPKGRLRLIHNPGLACGTGEHPCTQLALCAIETVIKPGCSVLDVGTGSGILAVAAKLLGAEVVVGVDSDGAALQAAHENFSLNLREALIACASANAVASDSFDVTVANISGTVLLSIIDDLVRVTRSGGKLLLTGFSEWELPFFVKSFPWAAVSELSEWRCVTAMIS